MKNDPLVIISNEKIFKDDDNFFCDNIEMKSLPEGLNNLNKIIYIGRASKIKRSHTIKIKNIKIATNIFR